MPILDKDGNVYKIAGPNVLMKDQHIWDKKKVKLINFQFGKVFNQTSTPQPTYEEPIQITTKNEETSIIEIPIEEPALELPVIVAPEPIPIVEPVQDIPIRNTEPVIEKPDEYISPKKKRISVFHCLPALDNGGYGEKFTFEGIPLEESDFQFMFWTNLKLNRNSIVYLSKRWWKVDTKEFKNKGYMTLCNISDLNPSFS